MISRCNLVVFIVLATGLSVANASELDQPVFKFGGYGTLGLSHSSEHLGDYVLDSTIPKGAGFSQNWSAGNDTRIAAHMTARFTPNVSAMLQVISEYQSNGSYSPDIEWANVKYSFTPDLYIRAGRVSLPTFMDSDNRDVGYSYAWIHPPVDLYRQLAIMGVNGIDAMYRFEIGDAVNTIKAVYGQDSLDRPTSISTSNHVTGIFDTIEYGSTIFHAGYQERASSSYNFMTGVTGPWIPNSDLSAGASYDPGDWFVMSEWIQRKSTVKVDAMYISAGYRVNKFTPYLTYSENSPGSILPGFLPTATINKSQSTDTLGVRWDFMRKTDFKLQYDQVRLSADSNGYLANIPGGPTGPTGLSLRGAKFHVISATVDFVF